MRPPGHTPQVTLSAEEATYTLATLLAGADGQVSASETRSVEAEWERYAAAKGIPQARARDVAKRCRDLQEEVGTKALLQACERTLRSLPEATEAVLMAVHVAYADGELAAGERRHLERILTLVGLSVDQLPLRTGAMRERND